MRIPARVLLWCAAIILMMVPVAGVLGGFIAPHRFPVRRLIVQASFRHVSMQQIRTVVVPYLGKGFFALPLVTIEHALSALPWIAAVSVRRRWPDTLVLSIAERLPLARWNDRQLISRRGVLFNVTHPESWQTLPSLRGARDRRSAVLDFFTWAHKLCASVQLPLVGVTLTDRGGWILTTAHGARIVLGDRADSRARLARFIHVYRQVMANQTAHFAYADLRYTNGFAMKWAGLTLLAKEHL